MYTGYHAPWDHYPKYLNYYEVRHPIKVLSEFFSADRPKGHKAALTEWQHFAIAIEHYQTKRFGPGPLLYTHELNIKLLEAMFLLLLEYRSAYPKPPVPTESELKSEKQTWDYFPKNLSGKELRNPLKAITRIFKELSLPQYREHLKEWLSEALTTKRNAEAISAVDIIRVYNNLLKLYSAAWVILQRSGEPLLKKPVDEDVAVNQLVVVKNGEQILLPQIAIKPFGPKLTPAEKLGLDEVIKVILKVEPSVQMISFLGIHPKPFTYYLLILIDDQVKVPEHEISNKIEDKCKPLVSVLTLVHKVNSARLGLTSGRRFWNLVMNKGVNVYKSQELLLPEPKSIPKEVLISRAFGNWQAWGIQGHGFFKGAKRYIEDGNYRLAAFLLHQAVESTLIGVTKVLLGYRVSFHNLSRILRITLLFTDDLLKIFEPDTEEGGQLFYLLQRAYSEARYKEAFDPDEQSIKWLSEKVELLLLNSEALVKQFLGAL